MYDEIVLEVDQENADLVRSTSLPELDLMERKHLQEWILRHPQLLGQGVGIVASEYDAFQTATGEKVLDRLDVLGLGPDGRLVVAELKRDVAPATIHMQAINYAAMVSRFTVGDIAELWATTHGSAEKPLDVEDVQTELETKWLLTPGSIRAPRIVLVAAGFPATLTASVVWLNERGVDITLIRFRPYRLEDGRVLVSFTRTFPVPDVEDFTIGRRRAGTDDSTAELPDVPWDRDALERLATQGNDATLALLDLCAEAEGVGVSVDDIVAHAGITRGQVKGQLAGLTMRLRNPNYGFAQNYWPAWVDWQSGGVASYHMDPDLAATWRSIRGQPAITTDV